MLPFSLNDLDLWFRVVGSESTGLSRTGLSMAWWGSECLYRAGCETPYLRPHGTAIKETHSLMMVVIMLPAI